MGIRLFDNWSYGHFAGGILFFIFFKSLNINDLHNFVISNILHLFIELFEKNILPNKVIIESNINHVGDIIVFILGWLLIYQSKLYKYLNKYIIIILNSVLIYYYINEIFKEIFVCNNRILNGAFIDEEKKTNIKFCFNNKIII